MNSSRGDAVLRERALDRDLDPLAGERLAFEREHAVRALRGAQHLARDRHARLGAALGAADPLELGLGLDAAAAREQLAVGAQLDAVLAQVVGELERERRRDDRRGDPELAAGAQHDLVVGLLARHAAVQEVVHPELLERAHLDLRVGLADPVGLERADDGDAAAAVLGVEERIRHRERHLVAHLGRSDRVGVDEDVRHRGADGTG